MNAIRYFMLAGLAVMTLAAIAIWVFNASSPASPTRLRREVGGVVPYLSLFGVLGFLVGMGLVVYEPYKYEAPGLELAAAGGFAIIGSILLARRKSRNLP